MNLLYNCITLSKYVLNKTFGFTDVEYIEFENTENDKDDDLYCGCNLCYTIRNIIYFCTNHLIYKKLK